MDPENFLYSTAFNTSQIFPCMAYSLTTVLFTMIASLKRGEMFLEEHPLSENEPQMSTWNGGIGDEQKSWLIEELKKAEMYISIIALFFPDLS